MRFCSFSLLAAAFFVSACSLLADETAAPREIGFFEAVDNGLIEASIVTYSSLDARVTVKNKTKEALRVALPDAFAAVHVYQFGGDDFGMDAGGGRSRGGRGGGNRGSGGAAQSSGGGFGNSNQRGMGIFSLPPERIVRQDVKTVCLEHGKREPRKHLRYEIRPIESVTDKEEVHMLCSLVGQGTVDQKAAQAAVWHYNNDLSWEELTRKQYKPRIDSPRTVPYFSRQQMMYAMNLGKTVEEKIAKEKETQRKGETNSASADAR